MVPPDISDELVEGIDIGQDCSVIGLPLFEQKSQTVSMEVIYDEIINFSMLWHHSNAKMHKIFIWGLSWFVSEKTKIFNYFSNIFQIIMHAPEVYQKKNGASFVLCQYDGI